MRNHYLLLGFLAGVLLLVSSPSVAQPQAPAAGAPVAAAIERLIARTVAEKGLIGLSAGVMDEGEVILARGYGARSLAPERPVTPETAFAIGSVSKQFTCAAALLLAEEGKLSLDDPVARYMPELTRAADVTLLQLGQHLSGYRDYYPLDFVHHAMALPASSLEIIRDFARRPLDFEPGSRRSYSNTGYLILGRVVEQAAGEPFGVFLERRILEPLGMTHTRYQPAADEPGLAEGYALYALGDPVPATLEGKGWMGAAGAIYSTPADLLAWDLALIDGKLLSADSYRAMTTPARLLDGRSTGYGCGLSVRTSGQAVILSHGGSVGGFQALNTILPARRSAIVLLSNREATYGTLTKLRDDILDQLLPEESTVPEVAGPSALEAAVSFIRRLRSGEVDRGELGEDFSVFLTPEKVAAASSSLSALGEMKSAEVDDTWERGGMEATTIRFTLGDEDLEANMFRTPDGKIQQLMIYRP